MKNESYIILRVILIFILITNYNLFSLEEQDSTVNKLEFIPSFHSIQIEGNIFIISYEFGGNIDFDLFRSKNNICIGSRFSVEHYSLGDFGGSKLGSPFTNYNLFLRLSTNHIYFSTDVYGGISYYVTSASNYYPNDYLPRIGFEIKYGNIIGIILRGSTSFKDRTGFFGIGIYLGYDHFL
ncbi:MAG: hypothetical protein K9J16_00190 [Melioribacteraceae bacterium]|nr:hypothetical protein [Melioribacteraceae bacterium]MCF8353928.1 hypothetical protein [Melioribacteraceae bacterium]MCF8392685.1 hypothetical protein [Melioribacteraceae bacterium]MCF8417706.1 hypothetical protein [Melioribacteraceae bacterium]